MKRLLLFISITVIASAATWALKAQQSVQQKEATIKLTQPEIEALYNIVDDAAVPGQIRKPLLQKIAAAYNFTFNPQPIPTTIKDSTKIKKN